MRQFTGGVIVGVILTASLGLAGTFYDSNGRPNAPTGSIQQYDYFRFRQQMIDINQLNQRAREDSAHRGLNPCK